MADYSNSKLEITKLTDRIFKMKPFEGAELDVDDFREARRVYLELSGGKSFAVLLDATNSFTTSPEARELVASKEYTDLRVAAAFFTSSMANRLIGNFFIRVNKPATPTRMFNDEQSALEWLKRITNFTE